MNFGLDNTYARLPDRFYAPVLPTKVPQPKLVKLNRALAEMLRLDPDVLDSPQGAEIFAGNALPDDAEALALAYAGHQFGGFVRQLGDGRAILLGELVGRDGKRRDVQLKGSGRTPFSRGGDGRAALGPVLREYIVSEGMAALGVPTTRSLAAVTTGERVYREGALPGAIVTRVAASHIRVGTFEFFAARDDQEALRTLTSYALERHYPDAAAAPNKALALLERVISAQAELVAQWMGFGFVHGVMNTDNTLISGETIDYGPCAFLDEFNPMKKFSSIDEGGRYAYGNQPRIAQWNAARFAETLLSQIADDQEAAVRAAMERLEAFPTQFADAHARVVRAKLGLVRQEDGDASLATDLLERLAKDKVDYTVFHRKLCDAALDPRADGAIAALFADPNTFHSWAAAWRGRTAREDLSPEAHAGSMRRANPAFIPRNHRIEAAIGAAEAGDYAPFEALVKVLARPFDDQPELADLAVPPEPHERVTATFCGT